MTEQEARTWIKKNWKRLIEEKKLDVALDKYFKKYAKPYEEDNDIIVDEAIKILGGGVLDE